MKNVTFFLIAINLKKHLEGNPRNSKQPKICKLSFAVKRNLLKYRMSEDLIKLRILHIIQKERGTFSKKAMIRIK
jgi:hypothetical protein